MPRFRASTLAIRALGMLALTPVDANAQRVGVNSAVNPDVNGLPPGAPARQLVFGGEVVFKERITESFHWRW